MMHQEPLIIDDFTVGENVWLYKLREGKDIRPWAQKIDTNNAETRKVLQVSVWVTCRPGSWPVISGRGSGRCCRCPGRR